MAVRGDIAAVFLDKDGTLLENLPYNVDPALMKPAPGAQAALRRLGSAGVPLVVVSNQSGVARGFFTEDALKAVAAYLERLASEHGARLLDFRYCPHFPTGVIAAYAVECDCRKPRPGLLLQAAGAHRLDLGRSWMVGDILDDVEAGRAAGCRTILLDNGNETEWGLSESRTPDFVAEDLDEAARIILQSAE